MKPNIIVLSTDDDSEGFKWLSDGWNEMSKSHTPEAQKLMAKANKCITDGEDVLDVIARLKKAGFTITRSK
jgi:hypothetical protein